MSKNILNKILLATLPLMAINANAATPQSFNYQSVVRSKSGSPIANQTVFVKVEILKDNLGSYEPVYSEMHNAQTNTYGSFAIKIGEGSAATGSFSGIDWSANKYVIRTSTSTNSDLTDAAVATTTMSSVPYALYSLRSADSFSGRWDDLTGKPDISEYAKIEDVAAYSADSTRKILTDYATKDDVLDLHNRGLRSSNYRIDSLKSVVNANNYWISELQSDAAKYATKSEISSLTSKDTLSSYTSKASFNSFTKTTSETIAELSQTVDANKALAESNYKNLKEVNKLYAKKDTLDYFMSKSGMSIYATNDDLRALDRSVGSLSQSISSTDLRASELTNTVSTLSTTVADNKKEINKKIETIQTELGKVDDKILVSERKAQADDLVLNNRISANESKIKGLTDKDSVLEVKFDSQTSAFNSQLDSISKSHTTAINDLTNTVSANAAASSKNMKNKIDSLSKSIKGKMDTLNINITGYVDGEVSTIENEIDGIETTLKNHASTLSSNSTSLSNLNSMMTQLVNWAQTINTKNDSLKKVLDEAKAKHKADSLKMEDRIKQDTAELRAIAKEYLTKAEAYKAKFEQLENILKDENLNTLINSKITTALSEAGLDDVNTLIENKIATALSEAGLDDINTLIDSKVATALSNAGLDDIDTLIDSKVATALSNAGLDDIKTRLKALEDKANNPGSGN
jgi:predicted  nucleic acid-binding Zn-ribbon protein